MTSAARAVIGMTLAAALAAHGGFLYTTNSDLTITIYADPGAGGLVDIPAEITGLPVSGIGDFAFDSSKLTNVTIPASVTTIGLAPFAGCPNLTAIAVAPANPVYGSTNGVLFDNTQGVLVEYPRGLQGAYVIPEGVGGVSPWAFALAAGLSNVTFPGGAVFIGSDTFNSCVGLTSVTFPTNLAGIGSAAFGFCTNITNFTFGGNAPLLGGGAFQSDSNATVYYRAGTSGWAAKFGGLLTVELNGPSPAGSLRVILLPAAAANAGATWQVDDGPRQPSGATVLGLTVGNHVVTFNEGRNWSPPTNQTVEVAGAATSTATGVYTELGSVQVVITPAAAAAAGATWQIDGGEPQISGATVYGLSPGKHALSFRTIGGWIVTSDQTLTVRAGSTTHVKGSYVFEGAGLYDGLFYPEAGVTEETSGMIKNLNVTLQGSYSGRLLIAGTSYSIAGSFDGFHNASNYIARAARLGGPLRMAMTLNWSNAVQDITGTVSGTNWIAALTNDFVITGGGSAQYAVLLTSGGAPPPGSGYLLVTNHAGSVTTTGALADGTSVNQNLPILATDKLPFYNSLYNNTGLAMGWINLTTNETLSGTVTWIKKGSRSLLYPGGFTNALTVSGEVWSTGLTPPGGPTINPPANLEISGGSLAAPIDYNADLGQNYAFTKLLGSATNSLVASVNRKTGFLSVTFGDGIGRATIAGRGVIQSATNGGGFFLSKTNAGSIVLQP